MCPQADSGGAEFFYQDHDRDLVDETPPVQNQWYEAFHAYDVRLIWCALLQLNDEAAAKTVEIRWTIDGTVYFESLNAASGTTYWIYKDIYGSTGGTAGLTSISSARNAAYNTDKRGLDFKVEIRLTGVPGTNQRLLCYCVRETQEVT